MSVVLTPDELDEASATSHPRLNSRYGRVLSRAACGLSALVIPWVLRRMGRSWTAEFTTEPGIAACLVAAEIFYLWAATGCAGLRALNRLDLERRIKIGEFQLEVTRGAKTSTYPWKRLSSYQETQNLFVLRTQVTVQFWTIPKRALSLDDREKLRSLLDRKLPPRI